MTTRMTDAPSVRRQQRQSCLHLTTCVTDAPAAQHCLHLKGPPQDEFTLTSRANLGCGRRERVAPHGQDPQGDSMSLLTHSSVAPCLPWRMLWRWCQRRDWALVLRPICWHGRLTLATYVLAIEMHGTCLGSNTRKTRRTVMAFPELL